MKQTNSIYNPKIDGDYSVNLDEILNEKKTFSEQKNNHDIDTKPPHIEKYPDGWNLPPVIFPETGIEGGADLEPIPGGPWFPGGPNGGIPISSGSIQPILPGSNTLGYYVPRQVVERNCFRCGYDPSVDFDRFNSLLPIQNRFGIHLIKKNIEGYVSINVEKVINGLLIPTADIPRFQSYFRYMYWIYVLAHEWGHYFAEVITVSNRKTLMYGYRDEALIRDLVFRYLNHLDITTSDPFFKYNDFEEVFSEWWGLANGIFDTRLHKNLGVINYTIPAGYIKIWGLKMSFIRGLYTNPLPYRDIIRWINATRLINPMNATQFTANPDRANTLLKSCISYAPAQFTKYDFMENNFISLASPVSKARFCPSNGFEFLNPKKYEPASTGERYKILSNTRGRSIVCDLSFLGVRSINRFNNLRNFTTIMELPEVYIH